MSFCGVTVTANKLANLPTHKKRRSNRSCSRGPIIGRIYWIYSIWISPGEPESLRFFERWEPQRSADKGLEYIPSAAISIIMATDEEAFARLCQAAFRQADPVGLAVLLAIERNDFAAGLAANPLPDAAVGGFKQALLAIGVPEGGQHLPDAQVVRLRAIKNAQRELFHVQNTQRQHDLVRQLLDAFPKQPGAVDSPTLCAEPQPVATAAAQFVARNISNIGAHPFLHGLRATLALQLERPRRCVIWRTPLTTISQSGGEAFASDAVTTLQRLHFFLSGTEPHQPADPHQEEVDGWADWQTHPRWSDRAIIGVLEQLPTSEQLEARPAVRFSTVFRFVSRLIVVCSDAQGERRWVNPLAVAAAGSATAEGGGSIRGVDQSIIDSFHIHDTFEEWHHSAAENPSDDQECEDLRGLYSKLQLHFTVYFSIDFQLIFD